MKYIIVVAAVVALILTVYIAFENLFILKIRREKIGKGIRIMHISDIHKRRFGKDNFKIAEIAKAEKPDLIFLTGDIVSRTEKDFSVTEKLLGELCKVSEVYFIYGNHEQSIITPDKAEQFSEMLSRTNVKLLRNSVAIANVKDRRINICGIELPYTTYKKNGTYFHLDRITTKDVTNLLGEAPNGETMLLAHNPLFGKEYAEWGADYTFSGHVHGGSVRMFGIGMLSPERKLFPKYSKGIYCFGNKKLLVSGGLGKLRVFNPPEIVIYEI